MAYITPEECATKIRWHTWPLIEDNLSTRERYYDWDDYWGELRAECGNNLLPYLDDEIFAKTGIDLNEEPFQFGTEQQLHNAIAVKENELNGIQAEEAIIREQQEKKMPPPNYVKLGTIFLVSSFIGFVIIKPRL